MFMTRRAVGLFTLFACAATQLCQAQVETRALELAPEIDAKCWFNAQPVRIHGAPRLILLEFWSARSRESREFADSLGKLYQAYKDQGSLLVVALTEDKCEETRGFVHREKLEYKIGAETRSADDYKIKEEDVPTIVEGRWRLGSDYPTFL